MTATLRPPQGFLDRMRELLGPEEFSAFARSFDAPRFGGLRWNPLKAPLGRLDTLGLALTPVPWEPNGFTYDPELRPGLHPWHEAGAYYLQEPSAMAPARLLDPQPGERVLDLCAAPGGKATQLASAMEGRGLLLANEIVPARARVLSRNIERLGISNALVTNEHPAGLAKRLPGWFDRVLVDAPCSGEGMFRKEPDAAKDWSEQQVLVCAARQQEILASGAELVAPGGFLVYSTCTFAPAENEGVITRFLAARPDFSLVQPPAPWFSPGRPDWTGAGDPELSKTVRLWPHRLRGEGHFSALLQRSPEAEAADAPRPMQADEPPEAWTRFLAETLPSCALPEGRYVRFGERWYLAPLQTPDLSGLKVLRAGLALGETAKGRFLPDHALALWLKSAASEADYPIGSSELTRYLSGQTLSGPQTGWTLVKADGLSLGWAKGSQGILKNHYPKGLRRQG